MARTYDEDDANFVSVADDDSLDFVNNWTLSVWFRTTRVSQKMIISKDTNGSNTRSWGIAVSVSSLQFISMFMFKTGDVETFIEGSTEFVDGEWHCVVGTYKFVTDGTSEMRVYVDGVLDVSTDLAVGPTQVTTTAVEIGRRGFAGFEDPFHGELGEAAAWNKTLSLSEAKALFSGISPTRIQNSALKMYLPLGVASPEPDWSGNGNSGTINGTLPIGDHAPVGPSFGFDIGHQPIPGVAPPPTVAPQYHHYQMSRLA